MMSGYRALEDGTVVRVNLDGTLTEVSSSRLNDKVIIRSFVLLTVLFFATLVLIGVGMRANRHLAKEGANSKQGLCALKADLQRRVTNTTTFLNENRDPLIFGIPRATIEQSRDNQQSTLDALVVLSC